jgi:hypothetical protein
VQRAGRGRMHETSEARTVGSTSARLPHFSVRTVAPNLAAAGTEANPIPERQIAVAVTVLDERARANGQRAPGQGRTRANCPLGTRRGFVHRTGTRFGEASHLSQSRRCRQGMTHVGKKLLTTKEAATLLDIQPGTLRRWRGTRKGPQFSRSGGTSRSRAMYVERNVRAWIASARKATVKP